jgi:nicotinamidase-related amidase
VKRLASLLDTKPMAKTRFSMVISDTEDWLLAHKDIDTILLCGLEAHVCINSTCIDLLHRGYNVSNSSANI